MSFNPHAMRTQSIVFPNGNQAHAIFASSTIEAQHVSSLLNLPPFSSVIMLMGGAGSMGKTDASRLTELFTHGIARFAATQNTLVIDGGTQSGVMELIGIALAEQAHKFSLLGVAPASLVSYPGQSSNMGQGEYVPLDPNHSHFVLVETDTWGGETATMYELAQLFSRNRPSVAILINGGTIALQETLYNVRQQRPIIVFQGSGRAAGDVARLWQEKPAIITDPNLAEIIRHGEIYVFPATGSGTELMQLIQRVSGYSRM